MLRAQYNNFVKKEQTKYIDEYNLRHLQSHSKTYGIIPDSKSKKYLEKVLQKLEQTDAKFRKRVQNREIRRIENELKNYKDKQREYACDEEDNEITEMIRVKLMQNAN